MNSNILKARIRLLIRMRAYRRLYQVLARLPASLHGFRAEIPFRIVDGLVAGDNAVAFKRLVPFKDFLPANQPLLFEAILAAFCRQQPDRLQEIALDAQMHPLTRFEAIGWGNFFRFRLTSGFLKKDQLPGKIVQFWDRPEMPPEIGAGVEKWRRVKGAQHELFDARRAGAFINSYYGHEARCQFEKLWHPALQSDLFRLYYILEKGGFYVDADSLPGKAAGRLALAGSGANDGGESNKVILSAMTTIPNCVTNNWFIAAPPGHTFIAGFLERVLANLAAARHKRIFWLSGPGALTLHVADQGHDICMLAHGRVRRTLFEQFDAPYKRTGLNWRVFENDKEYRDEDILPALLAQRTP